MLEIKVLLKKNENKLPLFYHQQRLDNDSKSDDESEKALQEFIKLTLLDPKFINYVDKVDKLFTACLEIEADSEEKN